MSLRSILSVTMVALAALALIATAALMVATTSLHRVTVHLGAAAESVRLARELEITLLVHSRARDGVVREDLERRLRGLLVALRRHVGMDEERALLAETERRIEAYLDAARLADGDSLLREDLPGAASPSLEAAFRSLDELVDLNIEQAREANEQSARWDRMADVLGMITGAALLLGVAGVIVWLRSHAFRPVFRIGEAMERFGSGDATARAPEAGPEELRNIAQRFNEMASAINRQQEERLAFLAGMAHDLRNPLSALRMSTGVIAPDRPLPSEERVRRTLGVVERQIAHLDRLVSDLLDAASIEAGQLELRFETRDVRELAREVYDLYQSASRRHDLELSLPDAPVIVRCDPGRIAQVLNNLVSNAIRYSPSGGRVEIGVSVDGSEVVLSVMDQGMGIAPEERERIFEPFRRSARGRNLIRGVGLGLSVARRIVHAHGGRIEVESALGVGSTFRVRFALGPTDR
jgi:two-component system sensor histidine kinase MtrB